jgi:hypothetical protein
MAVITNHSTRTSTGNFTVGGGTMLCHLTFKETTGAATASFTVRKDSSSGGVVCQRTLIANESDDADWANPVRATESGTPIFHLTVDSGAVSVTAQFA